MEELNHPGYNTGFVQVRIFSRVIFTLFAKTDGVDWLSKANPTPLPKIEIKMPNSCFCQLICIETWSCDQTEAKVT